MSRKTISRNVLRQRNVLWCEIRFNEKRTLPFLWRTKKIYTIYSGIVRAYPRSPESDFRWTTRSLFYQLKRALFFMRTQPMAAGPIAHSPLAVRRKQKSKLGRSEYTRIPRVCRWNLISAAFVTKHTAVLFSPFSPTRSPHPSLFILRARFSMRSRRHQPRERHDLCLKYTIESNEVEQHYKSN